MHLSLVGVMLWTLTCESAVPYARMLESSEISTAVMLCKGRRICLWCWGELYRIIINCLTDHSKIGSSGSCRSSNHGSISSISSGSSSMPYFLSSAVKLHSPGGMNKTWLSFSLVFLGWQNAMDSWINRWDKWEEGATKVTPICPWATNSVWEVEEGGRAYCHSS